MKMHCNYIPIKDWLGVFFYICNNREVVKFMQGEMLS